MLKIEMTERIRDELLKEIKEIQSDIWKFRTKSICTLEDCMDEIDSRLDDFINDLEIQLADYED